MFLIVVLSLLLGSSSGAAVSGYSISADSPEGVTSSGTGPAASLPAGGPNDFTIQAASVTLAPTGGPAGTIISASGSGYAPGSHFHFMMDSSSGPIIGMATPDASGNFLATFPIPLGTSPGIHQIIAGAASAAFTVGTTVVGSLPAGAPTLTLVPGVWKAGNTITASGTGLGATQGLDFMWDNPHGALTTNPSAPTTDANGVFSSVTFSPPAGSPDGFRLAVAIGKTNGRSASAALLEEATITLSPSSASMLQNETRDVNILVNSKAQPVNGVEVFLRFDPAVLQVVDAVTDDPTKPETIGVQTTIGDCGVSATTAPPLPTPGTHEVDNTFGTISLSRGIKLPGIGESSQALSVNCTLATVKFKGTGRGTSNVTLALPPAFPATKLVVDEALLPLTVTNSSIIVSTGEVSIAVTTGNNQSGQVLSTLANPLVATVTNASGAPVSGIPVTWTLTSPTGSTGQSLSVTSPNTNASGQASATLTLGAKSGAYTATATCATCTDTTKQKAVFTATGTAGPATQLAKISGDNQGGLVNAALAQPFVVEARDLYNNPVSGVVLTFTIASFPAGAVGQDIDQATAGAQSSVNATTDSGGQGKTGLTLGDKTGVYTVDVTSGALTKVTFTATAAGAQVKIDPATSRVSQGATTTVNVVATTPPAGLGAWGINVVYDPTVVTATVCTVPPATAGGLCNKASGVDTVRVNGASTGGLTGTVTLATITFSAVGARGTSTGLSVQVTTFADPSGAAVPVASQDGNIIVGCIPYDVNCSGAVDPIDALCVLRQDAGFPATPACPADSEFDANRNGTVDPIDALCVLRLDAGFPATPACPSFGAQSVGPIGGGAAFSVEEGGAGWPLFDTGERWDRWRALWRRE